jgi:hypothetical protein
MSLCTLNDQIYFKMTTYVINYSFLLIFKCNKLESENCNNLIFWVKAVIRMGMVFIYKQSLIFLFDYPAL